MSWRQKAKVKWASESDRYSTYFRRATEDVTRTSSTLLRRSLESC